MSKKLIVNEGEKIKIINNVSKLVTRLADGNVCTWIPEDETQLVVKNIVSDGVYVASEDVGAPYGYSQVAVSGAGNQVMGELGEKSIDKNGTYIASSDKDGPFYGYSVVTVNVAGSSDDGGGDGGGGSTPVTGKDPDGDDAMVTVDDDGQVVTEKLPVQIRVITTPDNLEYKDGQSIVFDGLYVKAYLKDGTEYCVVPNTDLIKPVTVAEYDEGQEGQGDYPQEDYSDREVTFSSGQYSFTLKGASPYLKARFYFYQGMGRYWPDCMLQSPIKENVSLVSSTVRVQSIGSFSLDPKSNVYWSNVDFDGNYDNNVFGWPTATGTFVEIMEKLYNDSQQTIPLQWKRPGDKKVLETSFTITVSSSGDNNTSGSTTPGGSNIDVPQ